MKGIKILLAAMVAAGALTAEAQISNDDIRADLKQRIESMGMPEYFSVFDRELTPEQREALEVLYAYMPVPDITDNSADFFLNNVDMALQARREMPWGAVIPDQVFRYFVLPVRVNNESLDGHREVFYNELKDRVKGLSLKDAILEVNHWCHEKVTYQPSDGRTHSPLLTVYTATGRCGEESTFTVAALRSVGIPARQVYTPRWAHTDDNHAWVEVWVDGKWHFLGACEPEAVLDLGWFNLPATRAMLVHGRTYGRYDGPEEVIVNKNGYTEISVTDIYAPVDTIFVTVVDTVGKPVPGATVDYRLFNYAEFFSLVSKTTDNDGRSHQVSGKGDLLIWASNGNRFGFAKGSVGKDREITVVLDHDPMTTGGLSFDMVAPESNYTPVVVPDDMQAENLRRFAREDSIRGAYTATFMTPEQAEALSAELGLDAKAMVKVMTEARANHKVLADFLRETPTSDRQRAFSLLKAIAKKDRSDITREVLDDHMTAPLVDSPLYVDYILNPRVVNEKVTPFRTYFRNVIDAKDAEQFRADPQKWVDWVARNITLCESWLPGAVRMEPESVWRTRVTNAPSRDNFFVKAARSMGIPARVDPVTGKTQWADTECIWHDAIFSPEDAPAAKTEQPGTLRLTFEQQGVVDDPKYYSHFTISKIVDGRPQLLEFSEDGTTWSNTFAEGIELDPGQYMIVSGQRLAIGTVMAHIDFITVESAKTTEMPLTLRQDDSRVQIIGGLNSELLYHDLKADRDKSILSTTGRGYFLVGIIKPNHEPTNHALRDIARRNPDFEEWGKSILLLFRNEDEATRHDASQLPDLPSTTVYGIDTDAKITNGICESLKISDSDLPIFVIADTFNNIVFLSQGYTIGLGDQLISTILQLRE